MDKVVNKLGNDNMRIGIITYGLESSITGIGRYTIELIKELSTVTAASTVLTLAAGKLGPLSQLDLPNASLLGSKRLPALMTIGSLQIPRIASRHSLDIVHDPLGVYPIAFGAGPAKTVCTIHDVIPLSFPGFSTRLDNFIYRHWLPYASKRVDAIITVSQASKADIIKYLHVPVDKVHVVPPGIHADFQPASRLQQRDVCEKYRLTQPYILYVGSVEKRKNLGRVLTAFGKFYKKRQSHKLVIVGPKKWHYTLIEKVFDEIDAGDNIIFTGYVVQEDLPAIYSAADLVIFPALYEGFGLPVLEAMACGTPVITSNVSSLPEVAGDAAILVDPYDVDAIVTALQKTLEDKNLRVQLRERGLQRAGRYGWSYTAEQTFLLYQTLLG